MAKVSTAQKKPNSNPNPKSKGDKLPLARKLEHEAIRTLTKLGKLGIRFSQLDHPAAKKVAEDIQSTLAEQSIAAFAEQVPDDAQKAKGVSRSPVAEGSVVDVWEKKIATYTDLLAENEMKGLVVKAIKGTKLLLQTAGGIRVFLPKGHVRPSQGGGVSAVK